VFINPVAGRGKARVDWETRIKPLMSESGKFDFACIFTERQGHAGNVIEEIFFNSTAAASSSRLPEVIIAIGGDGLVYEIFNGILRASKRVPGNDPLLGWLNDILICPLPSGSGNGLAFSTLCLAGEAFTMNCALRQLIRLETGRRDLGIVNFENDDPFSPSQEERIFGLTISWGLVADVDVMSDFLRFFGAARFTLYGLYRVLRKRLYNAVLHYTELGGVGEGTDIASDFLTVYASLVPVAGSTVILNPCKRMDSGSISFYSFHGKEMGRLDLVGALDEMGRRRDHIGKIKNFQELHVSDFELLPGQPGTQSGSAGIVVDGERLTHSTIRARILKNVTNCLVYIVYFLSFLM